MNTLRFVYKAQSLDQMHAAIAVEVSYSNELIKMCDNLWSTPILLHACLCAFQNVRGFYKHFKKNWFL